MCIRDRDKIAAYEKLTAAYDDTMALIELGNEEMCIRDRLLC